MKYFLLLALYMMLSIVSRFADCYGEIIEVGVDKIKGFTSQQLDKVLTLYPQLLSVYDLIRDFKAIFAAHHVENLAQWLTCAAAVGSPDFTSFVNGITRDIDAVRNAIICDYNNGIAEGCVNKIKRFKHTMYGRASFPMLEQNWRFIN